MTERAIRLRAFAVTMAVVLAWAATPGNSIARAAQPLIEANGPVTLGEPVGSSQVERVGAPDQSDDADGSAQGQVDARDDVAAADQNSTAAVDVESSAARPALKSSNEQRLLGKPEVTVRPQADAGDAASDAQVATQATSPPTSWRVGEITNVVGALAIVIGLVLLMRFVLRRAGGMLAGGSRPSGVLEILARYPVGRGQSLVLLKLVRRIVLVHQSGSAMTTLCEVTDGDEVASLLSRMEAGSAERDAMKFRRTLQEFMQAASSSASASKIAARPGLPPSDAEIVDLTRRRGGMWRSLFAGRSGT